MLSQVPGTRATAMDRGTASGNCAPPTTSMVVFTVPHELNGFRTHQPRAYYNLLFAASSEALLRVAADPEASRRRDRASSRSCIGWGSNLLLHPHIHSVVPAGGLSPDHQPRYNTSHPPFLRPLHACASSYRLPGLSRGLRTCITRDCLICCWHRLGFLRIPMLSPPPWEQPKKQRWVVDIRPPFGGP